MKKTPYDVCDEAMNDLIKSYKTNFALKRDKFEIRYRSKKKCSSESIVIHSKHWKKSGVFHPKSFPGVLNAFEPLPTKLVYDTRLQRTKLGTFYICILKPLDIRSDNQAPKKGDNGEGKVIALDPGVRTFMTGYDPDGFFTEWGTRDFARIY